MQKKKALSHSQKKILQQEKFDLPDLAKAFVDEGRGVASTDEALAGARDIIAEQISEHVDTRKKSA